MVENSLLKYYLSNYDNDFLSNALDIINPRKSAGSLAALDDFASDEYQNFIRLSLIEEGLAFGTKRFLGSPMKPYYETILPSDILDLLIKFYNSLYNDDHFIPISSIMGPSDNIIVNSKIKQYGRLRISIDIYDSVQAAYYKKSSYILARFVQNDETIDTFPGQVQFFFEHTIYLKDSQPSNHLLALVKWYKPVRDHETRYYCQVDNDVNTCNIELWSNEFYEMGRDSIIPIYNILEKFIKYKFDFGTKKLKEYMAIISLNKKILF